MKTRNDGPPPRGVGVFLNVFQPKNEYVCEQVARAELEPRAGFEPATITLPR